MSHVKFFRNHIISKYTNVMREFFKLMNQSEILKNSANPNPSLYIGMNAIHRVFEFTLLKTKSVDNAYYYSQKSYYIFLEYMEQINKSDLTQNLNHMDAILFVYKKTIYDIHDGETKNSSNTVSNIMSLNDDKMNYDDKQMKKILYQISVFSKIVFFWENDAINFEQRVAIANNHLERFLLRIDSIDLINSYLEMIQQKVSMDYNKYNELLEELIERFEKTKKNNILKEMDKDEIFLTKFYVEEDVFFEKFNEGTTKDLVKWMLCA